jgi:uncharacterized protein YuzE
MKSEFNFGMRVETNESTGEIMAVYWNIRNGKSQTVKEFADGAAFADYSRNGKLLGIELLAPCTIRVLDKIAGQKPAKAFLKNSIPRATLARS